MGKTKEIKRTRTISERIRQKMKELKITPAELAKKSNLTKATISRYLNDLRIPDSLSLIVLAKTLDTTAEWLLGEEDDHFYILREQKNNSYEIWQVIQKLNKKNREYLFKYARNLLNLQEYEEQKIIENLNNTDDK